MCSLNIDSYDIEEEVINNYYLINNGSIVRDLFGVDKTEIGKITDEGRIIATGKRILKSKNSNSKIEMPRFYFKQGDLLKCQKD